MRFVKDNGTSVGWEEVTPELVDTWTRKMAVGLSKTTINIYLRSLSAVTHLAYEAQLLHEPPKFLFRGLGIFSPNASNTRRHCYLPSFRWEELWRFFDSEGGSVRSEIGHWKEEGLHKCLEAAGHMLFMYLGNGMNLRDLCLLRYDRFFKASGGTQLQFCRHKTAARTNATVELPILREMRAVMERLAAKPKTGELIFPYLQEAAGDDAAEIMGTALLGSMMRKRMKRVAKALRWPTAPTPTWARHSFATNLVQAGVPKEYVSWAMAHRTNDVTGRYIASYSFEQMVEYNGLLLSPGGSAKHILAQIAVMNEEEKRLLMQELAKETVWRTTE